MKVAYVITRSDAVGGAQVHVRDIASMMQSRGHHPVILVGGSGPWINSLRDLGLEVVTLRHLRRSIRPVVDIKAFFELRAHLRRINPDIVSTHTAKAGWIGRMAARSLGLPVLFTAHGWTFTEGVPRAKALIWKLAERMVGNLAEKIITVSQYDRSLAIAEKVAPAHKIVTIVNGMPDLSSEWLATARNEIPQIVMVARFEAQKDQDTLLRALSCMTHLRWNMVFVGSGPRQGLMQALSTALGLDSRVTFFGASTQTQVATILSQSDVFVLSTHWEGLPRSIIEAMRARLPVVASRIAGIPELIDDGATGYLSRAGDPEHLAQCLSALIQSPSLRARMGAEARLKYLRLFQLDLTWNRTLAIYQQMLDESRGLSGSSPEYSLPSPYVRKSE